MKGTQAGFAGPGPGVCFFQIVIAAVAPETMMRAEMTAGGKGQGEAVRILLIFRTLPDLLLLLTQASAVVCISSFFGGFNFYFL